MKIEPKTCLVCGKAFYKKDSRHKTCSIECSRIWNRRDKYRKENKDRIK